MKILFGGAITILIREEDFTEINIDQDLISYIRPNGTQAVIKFKDKIPGFDLDHQDKFCSTSRWQEMTPPAEFKPQSPMVYTRNNQSQKPNKPQNTQEKRFIELDSNLNHLYQSFTSQHSEFMIAFNKKLMELEQRAEFGKNLKIDESSSGKTKEFEEGDVIFEKINQKLDNTGENLGLDFTETSKRMKTLDEDLEGTRFIEGEKKPWRQYRNRRKKHRFTSPNGTRYDYIIL